jgi:hypothetical protein
VSDRDRVDEELEALSRELRRLPTPMPPAALVSRVRRLGHLELAGRADEGFNRRVLVFLLLFAWAASLFPILALRLTVPWSVAYVASAWISGVAVLVLLGFQVRKERRPA